MDELKASKVKEGGWRGRRVGHPEGVVRCRKEGQLNRRQGDRSACCLQRARNRPQTGRSLPRSSAAALR